jgi:4-alpha-glucanotransferase
MQEYEKLLDELSDLSGIIPEYYDIFGKKHTISKESKVAILSAMDLAVGNADQVRLEIEKKRTRQWHEVLEPVKVISVHAQPHRLAVHLPMPEGKDHAAGITVTLEDEQGEKESIHYTGDSLQAGGQQAIQDRRFVRFLIPLPQKEIGYYTVSVSCAHSEPLFNNERSLEKSGRLIITPDSCHMPGKLQTGKTWGLAVNLYAIRSERNWGVGDFSDLRKIVPWLSGLNAGLVGINPLHEIPNTEPFGISPYSPISRLYRNFIYIDVESVPEISHLSDWNRSREKIAGLRKSVRVNYEAVAELKRELLQQAFEIFYRDHYLQETPRGRAFREYLHTEGAPLEKHALFLALSERMRSEHNASAWPEWPEEYRLPQSDAAAAFSKNNEKRILFFAYLQWLIDAQMAEVSAAASAAGMAVGLYGDLAIGAVDSGSDGWMYQDVLAEQATVGVPPDDFSAVGQNWGFPPMIPDKLRENGYELFIRTIRKNMEHMGALRIDHAPGLFRLFWIPGGLGPKDGAYVRCNQEDLLRIIALESVRNRTLVIGEDLGTITDEMREGLHRFGILSYRLFYFERNYPDPAFLPPERYPAMALSAITTHDLPTLYGYWSGRDLDVKKERGIIGDEAQYAQQKRDRERDMGLILQALRMRGMLPAASRGDGSGMPGMTPELCRAMYRYLSVSPSKIVLVSLDDVIGTMDQQNLPGTVSEYPNWMQKCPLLLEEITADHRWHDLADMFRTSRGIEEKTEAALA